MPYGCRANLPAGRAYGYMPAATDSLCVRHQYRCPNFDRHNNAHSNFNGDSAAYQHRPNCPFTSTYSNCNVDTYTDCYDREHSSNLTHGNTDSHSDSHPSSHINEHTRSITTPGRTRLKH